MSGTSATTMTRTKLPARDARYALFDISHTRFGPTGSSRRHKHMFDKKYFNYGLVDIFFQCGTADLRLPAQPDACSSLSEGARSGVAVQTPGLPGRLVCYRARHALTPRRCDRRGPACGARW